MKSIYPELALSGSKNEGARTDSVFIPISQVCTRGVTLAKTVKEIAINAPKKAKIASTKKYDFTKIAYNLV